MCYAYPIEKLQPSQDTEFMKKRRKLNCFHLPQMNGNKKASSYSKHVKISFPGHFSAALKLTQQLHDANFTATSRTVFRV